MMGGVGRRAWLALGLAAVLAGGRGSGAETFEPDLKSPLHAYFARPAKDRFSRRIAEIEAAGWATDRSNEVAVLRGLLRALDVPETSQLWVFSNTSLQLSLISPSNPRALYFSDEIYVGYVPGGRIEVASVDPELGAVFHIFDLPRGTGGGGVRVERATRCMNCHAGEDTGNVPGLSIRSVVPGPGGGSLDAFRQGRTGHDVPLAERFGGWYVTGAEAIPVHWGNRMGRMTGGEVGWTPLKPGERFRVERYPVPTSELLAHLLHEHQAGFVNRAVRLQYRYREWTGGGGAGLSEEASAELDREVGAFVRYLLFADEVVLPEGGVKGAEAFREAFRRNRRDVEGGSLKDFDLGTRLFRNRCSYLVYSDLFTGLAPEVRRRVVAGLREAVGGGPAGAHLGVDERGRLGKILTATLPGWGVK